MAFELILPVIAWCLVVIKCLQPPELPCWNPIIFEPIEPGTPPPLISSWARGVSVEIPTFEDIVVTPLTFNVPIVEVFPNLAVPLTSNANTGVCVKIPTPAAVIVKEFSLPIPTPEESIKESVKICDLFNQKRMAFELTLELLIEWCLVVIKCLKPPSRCWKEIIFEPAVTGSLPPLISSWAKVVSVKRPTLEENLVWPLTSNTIEVFELLLIPILPELLIPATEPEPEPLKTLPLEYNNPVKFIFPLTSRL